MKKGYNISIYHDIASKRVNSHKHPVKVRVWSAKLKTRKLYSIDIDLTPQEFDEIWKKDRVKPKYKKLRLDLQKAETRANDVASSIPIFTFEEFKKRFYGYGGHDLKSVNYFFTKVIEEKRDAGDVKTATGYGSALKSFLRYHKKDSLHFEEVTVTWLKKYERWMESKGRSLTTVGMYVRNLRAVFNLAIDDNVIPKDIYPFGVKKYSPPQPKGGKHQAMTKDQYLLFVDAKPSTLEQEFAKDFWLFSFFCNGMNFKDISKLKYGDINGEKFAFYREKSKRTNRHQQRVTVLLNDFTKDLIKKYGTPIKSPDAYVFDIISKGTSQERQDKDRYNFIRRINKNLKKLVEVNGLDFCPTTYWARHTFATLGIIEGGASLEKMSQYLNHSSIQTTKNYFAGFEDKQQKSLMDKLSNLGR